MVFEGSLGAAKTGGITGLRETLFLAILLPSF